MQIGGTLAPGCISCFLRRIFLRDSPSLVLKGFWNILYFILMDKNNVVLRAAPPLYPLTSARCQKLKEQRKLGSFQLITTDF